MAEGDPREVAVAGDWHGNTRWAIHAIESAAKELDGQPVKILLHVGDFLPTFYWPPKRPGWTAQGDEDAAADRRKNVGRFLWTVTETLRRLDMQLLFADGNHEDWELLKNAQVLHAAALSDAGVKAAAILETPVPVFPGIGKATPMTLPHTHCRIWWLPRGTRWEWHGKEWLAFGGAVSPNRAHLTEGWNWWPEEKPSLEEARAAVAGGHADVVLAHDVPASVHIQMMEPPKSWDKADLDRGAAYRKDLDAIAAEVTPEMWIHGHHHIGYCKGVNQPWGLMWSTGLEADGGKLNVMVLDLENLSWRLPASS